MLQRNSTPTEIETIRYSLRRSAGDSKPRVSCYIECGRSNDRLEGFHQRTPMAQIPTRNYIEPPFKDTSQAHKEHTRGTDIQRRARGEESLSIDDETVQQLCQRCECFRRSSIGIDSLQVWLGNRRHGSVDTLE